MSTRTQSAGLVSSQGQYAWDARAARLRYLAREAEVGVGSGPRRPASTTDNL
jgi:hypothetical protein